MSNTTIQLRHSTETGNVPVSLANGEIAINTQDGKLFYADPNGTVQEFSGFPGPSGLDTEIQFNDSGVLGANSRLTFDKTTGTLTVNGTVVANVFSDDGTNLLVFANNAYTHANAAFEAANSGGGGGSIAVTVDTSPPASGNTIGDIWIDTDTGKEFRWIDDGDSYQWVEFGGNDGADGINGINGSDADVGPVFAHANAAYDTANSTYNLTVASYAHSNASYTLANTNSVSLLFAYLHANAAFEQANNVIDNYARDHSNSAFDTANSNSTTISFAYNHANAAFDSANTTIDTYARDQANAAFDAANTKVSTGKAIAMSIVFG